MNKPKSNQNQLHIENATETGCTFDELEEILDGEFCEESYDDARKITNFGVLNRIEQEGIGYALLHWRIEGKNCRNPKLGYLIDNAFNALTELTEYLDKVLKKEKEEQKK